MKLTLLILALALSLYSSAQMNHLFFGQSLKELPALTDSIKAALPGYSLDSSSVSKSGKSLTLYFNNASGSSLEANILKIGQEGGSIGTIQIKGSKEAVLALYSRYVNSSAVEPVLTLAKLPSGQSLPIACFENRSSWILVSKSPY